MWLSRTFFLPLQLLAAPSTSDSKCKWDVLHRDEKDPVTSLPGKENRRNRLQNFPECRLGPR